MKNLPTERTTPQADQLRRSCRARKPMKHDYFSISTGRYEDLGIPDLGDDDFEPKFGRRKGRKDSDDYENTPKYSKKTNGNRISNLLDWKKSSLVSDATDDRAQQTISYKVKHIPTTDLSKYGSNLEAIFVNCKWQNQRNPRGLTIKEFNKLGLESTELMSKGIVFIWSEKELLSEIMEVMEKKNFVYVQNFQIIYLSQQLCNEELGKYCSKPAQKSSSTQICEEFLDNMEKLPINVDPNRMIVEKDSPYFKRSKRTLLMFRKISQASLELRHQRTCDVLFDIVSENCLQNDSRTRSYVYRMIETLLPKAIDPKQTNPNKFKLMQLWAEEKRGGWISIVQK